MKKTVRRARALLGASLMAMALAAACESSGTASTPAATVRLERRGELLAAGEARELAVSAYDASGRELRDRGVTWASSRPDVVSVDETGLATARREGFATLTATVDGRRAEMAVEVNAHPFGECAAKPAAAGGRIHAGELVADDCRGDQGMPVDVYRVDISTTRTVSLAARSAEFGTDLRVWDARSGETILGTPAGGPEARIKRSLMAGRYYVAVSGHQDGDAGRYELILD